MVRRDIPDNPSVENFIKKLKRVRERLVNDLIKQHFFEQKSRMSFMTDVGIPSVQILETVDRESSFIVFNRGKKNEK